MAKKRKSLAGLGAKYGAPVRKRYTRVIRTLRAKRSCPQCGSWKFKRQASGIWGCRLCGHMVAGGAYDLKLTA